MDFFKCKMNGNLSFQNASLGGFALDFQSCTFAGDLTFENCNFWEQTKLDVINCRLSGGLEIRSGNESGECRVRRVLIEANEIAEDLYIGGIYAKDAFRIERCSIKGRTFVAGVGCDQGIVLRDSGKQSNLFLSSIRAKEGLYLSNIQVGGDSFIDFGGTSLCVLKSVRSEASAILTLICEDESTSLAFEECQCLSVHVQGSNGPGASMQGLRAIDSSFDVLDIQSMILEQFLASNIAVGQLLQAANLEVRGAFELRGANLSENAAASWNGARFHQGALFEDMHHQGPDGEMGPRFFLRRVWWDGAYPFIFRGSGSTDARSCDLRYASLAFSDVARMEFQNCRWNQTSSGAIRVADELDGNSDILSMISTYEKEENSSIGSGYLWEMYRQLRISYETSGRYQEAGGFHQTEWKHSQHRNVWKGKWGKWWWHRIGLQPWYGRLSGYGERPGRAALVLIVWLLAWAGFIRWIRPKVEPSEPSWLHAWLIEALGLFPANLAGSSLSEFIATLGASVLVALIIIGLRRQLRR